MLCPREPCRRPALHSRGLCCQDRGWGSEMTPYVFGFIRLWPTGKGRGGIPSFPPEAFYYQARGRAPSPGVGSSPCVFRSDSGEMEPPFWPGGLEPHPLKMGQPEGTELSLSVLLKLWEKGELSGVVPLRQAGSGVGGGGGSDGGRGDAGGRQGGTTSRCRPMLLVGSIFGLCYQELGESRRFPFPAPGNFLTGAARSQTGEWDRRIPFPHPSPQ